MLNYYEFLLESKNLTTFYLSNKLANILEDIDTGISVKLLSLQDHKVPTDITYIDVVNKNTLSFVSIQRVDRMYKDSGTDSDFDVWMTDMFMDDKSIVWERLRMTITVGRFVKRIMSIVDYKITDIELGEFVTDFIVAHDKVELLDHFKIVSGEEIRHWYLEDNYGEGRGNLNSSCMRYDECQKYLELYVRNSDACRLLIMFSDTEPGKIVGRALIWKVDNIKTYFMDVVYCTTPEVKKMFINYGELNNMKNWITGTAVFNNDMCITLKKVQFKYYPYLDSFVFLDMDNLKLRMKDDDDEFMMLSSTDGGYFIEDDEHFNT